MSFSLGNNNKEKNTSLECKKAASVAWRVTVGSTCMKYEATEASLLSVKLRSCLSFRQGDNNLKHVFIIAEGGIKAYLGSTAFLGHYSDEYCILLLRSPANCTAKLEDYLVQE